MKKYEVVIYAGSTPIDEMEVDANSQEEAEQIGLDRFSASSLGVSARERDEEGDYQEEES